MYAAEFFADTAMLTAAELGALIRLMCQHWRSGDLGADKQMLEEHALGEVTDRVLHHYRREAERLNILRTEYEELSVIRSKSGSKGGKAKAKHLLSKSLAKGVGVIVGDTVQDKVKKEHARSTTAIPFDEFRARCLQVHQSQRILSDEQSRAFFDYWTEGHPDTKPRYCREKVFDIAKRMRTWARNNFGNHQPAQPPNANLKPWLQP